MPLPPTTFPLAPIPSGTIRSLPSQEWPKDLFLSHAHDDHAIAGRAVTVGVRAIDLDVVHGPEGVQHGADRLHVIPVGLAHLVIVLAGLAISRYLEIQTGMSLKQILKAAGKVLTHKVTNIKTGETAFIETTIEDPRMKQKIELLKSLGH